MTENKKIYQNFQDIATTILIEIFILLNATLEKQNVLVNNLNFYFKKLEKQRAC